MKKTFKDGGQKQVEKAKKPFYKRLWFKIVAGIFVLAVIGNIINPPEKTSENKDTTEQTEQATEITESTQAAKSIDETEIESISNEDYELYQKVQHELSANLEKSEEEIFNELAVEYETTGDELKARYDSISDQALERNLSENKKKQEEAKESLEDKKLYVQTLAQYFVEEQEMKKLKGFSPSNSWKVVVYSSEPVHDISGNEYPYSYQIAGRYEEKGNGQLNDFFMVIGYKNEEDVKDQTAVLLQYINTTNGNYYENLDEEDNVLLQLQNLNNE